jgi:hypothetical protein
VTYFLKGNQYIRATRGEAGFGNSGDPGYPKTVEGGWGWPAPFANGVKGAPPSGLKCNFFFSGTEYIRVSRGLELAGFIEKPTQPASLGGPGRPSLGSEHTVSTLHSTAEVICSRSHLVV